jgi:ribosomal protein S18 acetylase RimI-like enzyme
MQNTGVRVRRSEPEDVTEIARIVTDAFAREFQQITKDLNKVTAVLEKSIVPNMFWVAEQTGKIVAVAAVSNCKSRAVKLDHGEVREKFGFLKSLIFQILGKLELENPEVKNPEEGYIEYVAVKADERGQGLSAILLEEVMQQTDYKKFALDARNSNAPAKRTYAKLGFTTDKRSLLPSLATGDFSRKVIMSYEKDI